MALSDRERRIIITSMSFFRDYGEAFVELIKGDKEENQKAWKVLREEIVSLRSKLAEQFKKSPAPKH